MTSRAARCLIQSALSTSCRGIARPQGLYLVRSASTLAERKWSTPLAKTIAGAIQTTGPISLANFMRQCLTSPEGGYYTQRDQSKDQFGRKGDFITSPEISQVFGELIGIWIVAEWIAQGKINQGVEIVEVGPGRGTLMDDLLRTISTFKPLVSSIESIYLVEASTSLREAQRKLLCGTHALEKVEGGYRCMSKYADIPITWCEDIRFVPKDSSRTPFIVAHEFFDALPIYAFQSVAPRTQGSTQMLETPTGPIPLSKTSKEAQRPQWRELMVANKSGSSGGSIAATQNHVEFELALAKASTPTSTLLPGLSPRYKALLPRSGSTVEISPESHSYAAEMARRIGGAPASNAGQPRAKVVPQKERPSGAALILDYGPSDTVPVSTLRGIREHKIVSPFASPGQVDLSADVDFTALADAALAASPGIEVHGPVEQGTWLEAMGIRARADIICREMGDDVEGKKRIMGAVERLVERGGGAMGRLYKVMAVVPERGGKRPVGFGGELGG